MMASALNSKLESEIIGYGTVKELRELANHVCCSAKLINAPMFKR